MFWGNFCIVVLQNPKCPFMFCKCNLFLWCLNSTSLPPTPIFQSKQMFQKRFCSYFVTVTKQESHLTRNNICHIMSIVATVGKYLEIIMVILVVLVHKTELRPDNPRAQFIQSHETQNILEILCRSITFLMFHFILVSFVLCTFCIAHFFKLISS